MTPKPTPLTRAEAHEFLRFMQGNSSMQFWTAGDLGRQITGADLVRYVQLLEARHDTLAAAIARAVEGQPIIPKGEDS